MEDRERITSFTQLTTWKEAHKLVLLVYKVSKNFPEKENFALTSQMTRAAISITSNIAEGFTRSSQKEKKQFYYTAKASLTELQNQLIIARDVGYISQRTFEEIADQTITVTKLLNGLIKGISKLKPRI